VNAPNNSATNKYVQQLKLNGKLHTKNYVDHFELMKGGLLDFNMSPVPNKQRGINKTVFPYSFSK
jgi:putative alpha-1,2-mannosidase